VKELKERIEGHPDPSIEELFKKVGMDGFYDAQYRLYSADVHSNPPSLEPLFEYDVNKEIISFRWGPAIEQDLRLEILECARLLMTGLRFVQGLFKVKIDDEISALFTEYQRLGRKLESNSEV
jgi:hypothetical protein